jgi:alpha-tubulin suppressor-like RCC1 family protein
MALIVAIVSVIPAQPAAASSATPLPTTGRAGVSISPTKALAKERVSVAAKVPGPARRVVLLQRQAGSRWVTVERARSSKSRNVSFTFRPKATTVVRLSAPAVGGAAAFTSPSAKVTVVPQRLELTLPTTSMCADKEYDATVVASPVRQRRGTTLQVSDDRGKTWETLGPTRPQAANGRATITFSAPGTAGEYRIRAVAKSFNGTPAFASKARTVTVTICAIVTQEVPFVVGGADHTCMIDADQDTLCWGSRSDGQTGTGDWSNTPLVYPTPVASSLRFATLVAGSVHTCGLLADGTAYCWGNNGEFTPGTGSGALGTGTSTDAATPVPVAGGHKFRSLAAGASHTCGIATTGRTYCWGANKYGQVGDGSPTDTADEDRLSPTLVSGGWTFASIYAHRRKSCALTSTGVAYCWGISAYGYLNVPTKVQTDLRFTTLTLGTATVCGVATNSNTYCWDQELSGSFGDGSSGPAFTQTPQLVAGGHDFTKLTSGLEHVCGVTAEGAAFCWGDNGVAAIGNGTSGGIVHEPVAVLGSLSFRQLSAGYNHNCGVSATSVACWGFNGRGQLATGTSGVEVRNVPNIILLGP